MVRFRVYFVGTGLKFDVHLVKIKTSFGVNLHFGVFNSVSISNFESQFDFYWYFEVFNLVSTLTLNSLFGLEFNL